MDIFLSKLPTGALVPDTEKDAELLKKFKVGEPVRCKLTKPRNYKFHKKYWSLIRHAFDCWEPDEPEVPAFHKIAPEKNLDRFRDDLTILSGFYTSSIRVNGEVRLEARSISFGNMSQDDFDDLYSKTIDAILKHVLRNYTKEDLDMVVEEIMSYA